MTLLLPQVRRAALNIAARCLQGFSLNPAQIDNPLLALVRDTYPANAI
jgi:hypothetical protein